MYGQYKARFNRSEPRVLRAADLKARYEEKNGGHKVNHGRLSKSQASRWRPIALDTLGFLAATGKVSIVVVHQRLDDAGENARVKFKRAFFDAVNLDNPSDLEMKQINLFSHLLF